MFSDLSGYRLLWSLEADGNTLQSGEVPSTLFARTPPGGTARITLPVEAAEEGVVTLTFRWIQKADSPWADAGYEQAFDQFVLQSRTRAAQIPPQGKLDLTKTDTAVTVRGEGFSMRFERGALVSWIRGGEEYLFRPLKPNYYRAMTDNDRGLSNFVPPLLPLLAESGWKRANTRILGDMRAILTGDSVYVHVRWRHPFFRREETVYRIFTNGSIELAHLASTRRRKPIRIGMQCSLTSGFDRAEWVGRGPGENYLDRKSGCAIGRYQSEIAALEHPYMRPQENGARCDVESLSLEGEGKRLTIERLSDSLQFSAWRYSQEALDAAEHQHELTREAETTLSLDGAMRGVGGDLPGMLALHPPFELKARTEYRLHILMKAGR